VQSESPSVRARWPIFRVESAAVLQVELLSGSWIRLATHYSGRTFLCADCEECPLCELLPARAFWYLPAVKIPGRRPGLLELSAHASADLEQVANLAFGSVGAGCRLDLSRRSAKAPIRSEAVSFTASPDRVRVDEWGSCLMAIYGLPPMHCEEAVAVYGDRVRPLLMTRARVTADRLRSRSK